MFDRHRVRRLDGGAIEERAAEAAEPGRADLVDPRVAGVDVGEHRLVRGVDRRGVRPGVLRLRGPRHGQHEGATGRRRQCRPPCPAPVRRARPDTISVARTSSASSASASADQPRTEPDLLGPLQRLDPHALGQRRERRQRVALAHHVQGDPPLAAGVDAGRHLRRGSRAASRSPGTPATRLGGPSSPKPFMSCSGVQIVPISVSGSGALPPALWVSRSSICTKRPDSGRLDQSALAVTWNEHHAAVAERRAGDERRAVLEARQHPLRQVRVGLRHHLAGDVDVGRHRQPGEGAVLRERLQPPRRAPGHRAAERCGRRRAAAPAAADPPRAGRRPTAPAAARRSAAAGRPSRPRGSASARSASPRLPTSARTSTSGAAFSISASGASITSANGSSALRR